MLGGFDQLGEADKPVACLEVARARHLDENCVVTLNDQRIFSLGVGHRE